MIQKNFDLSLDGISDLDEYLRKLKEDIEHYPTELVQEVCDVGKEQLTAYDARADHDENYETNISGYVTRERIGECDGIISYYGLQVAYVEFGTGMVGKASPHPQASEAGYEYYVPSEFKATVNGEAGWWFQDRFKVGIPSQRPVYNTARYLREHINRIAKEAWRGE